MVRAAVQRQAGGHGGRSPRLRPLDARLPVHGPGQARRAEGVRAAHPPVRERAAGRRLQRQGRAVDAAQLEAGAARRRFPRHRARVSSRYNIIIALVRSSRLVANRHYCTSMCQ